jgi:ABC-type nitrate/sulfonate/bicarbonate transport system substrate-binding protein
MKRRIILLAPIVLLLFAQTSASGADTPLKIINVAVPAVSLLQAPLFVAMDAGAFKKYGMEVRYIRTGARTRHWSVAPFSSPRVCPAGRSPPRFSAAPTWY